MRLRDVPIWLAIAASALVLTGCRQPSAPSGHFVVSGIVESVRPETADLSIRPTAKMPARVQLESLLCLFTEGTEVYVNDRVTGMENISEGDAVELVGYFESSTAQGVRFVVLLANVKHELPPVDPPIVLSTAPPSPQPPDDRAPETSKE